MCIYTELSKPSFTVPAVYQEKMKESRKVLFPKTTSELAGFFLTLLHAERQRGSLWNKH